VTARQTFPKGDAGRNPERPNPPAGDERTVSCSVAARKGHGGARAQPEERFAAPKVRGGSLEMGAKAPTYSGSGGVVDPQGSRGGVPWSKESESASAAKCSRTGCSNAYRPREVEAPDPVYAGTEARPTCPMAKASHAGQASKIVGASRTIGYRRWPEAVKTVEGRPEETRVDPGGRRPLRKRRGTVDPTATSGSGSQHRQRS